jgi:RNA polymerase sigma-70 factor (sigma-E family)
MTATSSVPEVPGGVPISREADPPTFAVVYECTYARMLRLARLSLDGGETAEEIVQDAFLQLFRNWDHIDAPVPWLRKAVVNGCRSWGRRRQVARRHPADAPPPIVDNGDALAVREALRSLRPRQRAAVVLRYFEDLPEREIAEVLGCRPGTVKSILSRSLHQLREVLDD